MELLKNITAELGDMPLEKVEEENEEDDDDEEWEDDEGDDEEMKDS